MEAWRTIENFPNYEVSDNGQVRNRLSGRVLRPGKMSGGHLSVALGRGNTRCVHRLVLEAFVGPRPEGYEARHLDGDHTHNKVSNLAWGSRAENTRDKKFHFGQNGRLRFEEVLRIKIALAFKVDRKHLSSHYGVSVSAIHEIARGRNHHDIRTPGLPH